MDVRTRPGTMLAETWLACRSKGQTSGREGEGDAGAEGEVDARQHDHRKSTSDPGLVEEDLGVEEKRTGASWR